MYAINSLDDDQLQQYLKNYNIEHESLDRPGRLHELKAHIGCIGDGTVSALPTVMVMLLLAAALFVLWPDMVVF